MNAKYFLWIVGFCALMLAAVHSLDFTSITSHIFDSVSIARTSSPVFLRKNNLNLSKVKAKEDLSELSQFLAASKPPIVVGGIGDSGTRGVWQALHDVKVYMGNRKELWKTTKDCIPFMKNYSLTSDNGTIIRLRASKFYNPAIKNTHNIDYGIDSYDNKERWYMGLQYMTKVIHRLYSAVSEYQNSRKKYYEHIWGFKHPRTVLMLPFLKTVLDNTTGFKFLHVIRDGRDVAKGKNQAFYRNMCHKFYPNEFGHNNCASTRKARMLFWANMNEQIVEWAKTYLEKDQYLAVRIEDLVSGKPECLKRIADFASQQPAKKRLNELALSYTEYNETYNGNKWTQEERTELNRFARNSPKIQEMLRLFGYNLESNMGTVTSCLDLNMVNFKPKIKQVSRTEITDSELIRNGINIEDNMTDVFVVSTLAPYAKTNN